MLPTLASVLLLAGCATQQDAFNNVTVTKPVSWDTALAEKLQKDGWSVTITPTAEQKKQVKDAPTTFQAFKNDPKCVIIYGSEPYSTKSVTLGDKFNTQSFILEKVSLVNPNDALNMSFEVMQSNVKNSPQKIGMMYGTYVEPYYNNTTMTEQEKQALDNGTAGFDESKPDGDIYSFITARNFSTSLIDNPFYELGRQYGSSMGKKTTSAVYVQYQCLNNKLDDKIIDLIKTESTLIIK